MGDVGVIADIKANDRIRKYSESFQHALAKAGDEGVDRLFEDLASAWDSAELRDTVAGAFSTTNRILQPVGMIPGAGTVTTLAGMGADAAGEVARRNAEKHRWYELGPEIARFQTLRALERDLQERGLR
jgi:hypothetical protein